MLDHVNPTGSEPHPADDVAPAVQRFRACRWHANGEGEAEHCAHPEVLPFAGIGGFNPEAWCLDCAFYKTRRTARKPQAD